MRASSRKAISRKVISCILAAALMLGMCPAMTLFAAAEETESSIFYNRTFEEDIALGTSPEGAYGNGSTISLETEESGNKYVKIVKADNTNDANFTVMLKKNPLSSVVVEIDLSYTGTLIPTSLYYTNKDSNADGQRKNANLIDITADGKVTVGSGKTELTTLSRGQWTRFGFVINLENNTADVYVNGTKTQTGVALAAEGFGKLGFVRLMTGSAAYLKGCDLAFDNFRIYAGSALRDWDEDSLRVFYNRTYDEGKDITCSIGSFTANGNAIEAKTADDNTFVSITKSTNSANAYFQTSIDETVTKLVTEIDLAYFTDQVVPANLYFSDDSQAGWQSRIDTQLVAVDANGKVTVKGQEIATLTKGQWMKLGFVFDLSTKTCTAVFVDGEQKAADIALGGPVQSKLGFMRVMISGDAADAGKEICFDNFRIYEGTKLRDLKGVNPSDKSEDSLRVFYNRTYNEGKDIDCSISQVNTNGNTVVAKTVDDNTFVSMVKGANGNNASFQANIDETVTNLVTEIDLAYYSDNVVPASLYFSNDSQAGWQSRVDTSLADVDADGKVTVKGQEIATLTKGQWVKLGFAIDLSTKTCTAVFVNGELKATDIALGGPAQSMLGFMRVMISSAAADAGKEICLDNFRIYEGTKLRDLKGVNPSEMQDPVQSEEGPLWETFPENYGSVDADKILSFTQSIMDTAIDNVPLVRFTDSMDSLYAGWTNLEKRSSTAIYYLTLSEYLNQGAKSSVTGKTAKDRVLEQFRALIKGGNEPFACSGPYLSHAVVSSAIVLAKNTPSIWNSLTDDEHERLDCLMKALAICGNWSFNDANNYETGFDMKGNFNKNWNPNYRNTYLTAVGNACLYFGGADQLNEIFTTFSYDVYVAKFTELGFTNILASWTTAGKDLMENGGTATLVSGGGGGTGAGVKVEFKFNGHGLDELTAIALEQFIATYDANVVSTAGKAGTSAYSYILGDKTSPYEGYYGMMYEFVSADAYGLRSSADYAYSSMINVVPYLLNLKMLGGWNSASNEDQLKLEKMMFVGHEDLIFKLENGYHSFMKGSGSDEYEQTLEVKGYAMIKDLWKKAFLYSPAETTISEDPGMVSYPSVAPKDQIAWAPEGALTVTYINDVTAEDYIKLNANGSSNFTVEWDINLDTDVASTFDGVIAFTQDRNVPAAYSGFNALIQMQKGTFNVYNSNGYVNSEVAVWGNYKYHVRVEFDVTAGTYSVYVEQTYPNTTAEACIAENYQYRATAGTPTAIEYMLLVRQNGDADYWIENLRVKTDGDEDEPQQFAVTFQTNGGTPVATQYVNEGEKVAKPEDPTRSGYEFAGWFSDEGLSEKWDFEENSVSSDLTLYAKWTLVISDKPAGTGTSGSNVPVKLPFTDVAKQNWFYDDVVYVYENGLMNGTSSTTFAPEQKTTRAMIVTILWRLEGSPAAKEAAEFQDVSAGAYYAEAVAWAAENGIVNGFGDGRFAPDDAITREQLAAILYRYSRYCGQSTAATASLDSFSDAASVSGYAREALVWAYEAGIVRGTSDNQINPIGFATRAEAAAMLHRYLKK